MILDKLLEFADAATLNTGGAATYNLTNQIDTGSVVRDLGNGEEIYLVVTVDTSITSGGTATLQYLLVSDDTASIATNGTATQHAASRTVTVPATANAATGTIAGSIAWVTPLPQGVAYERYLGVQTVVGTAALTAGKVNAFLTRDRTIWQSYADALTPLALE